MKTEAMRKGHLTMSLEVKHEEFVHVNDVAVRRRQNSRQAWLNDEQLFVHG